VNLRRATTDDLDDVLALIGRGDERSRDWTLDGNPHAPQAEDDRRELSHAIADPDCFNEVAEADGRLLGFVNFVPAGERIARLSYLFVDPEHWGEGIGRDLHAHAIDEMRRRGYRAGELITPELNTRARRFYERAGWTDSGYRGADEKLGLTMARYTCILRAP
jgi:GNAT superfamily N-acetyltransferase